MLRLHLLQLDQYFDILLRKIGTFADGCLAAFDDRYLTMSKRTDGNGAVRGEITPTRTIQSIPRLRNRSAGCSVDAV